jgi:hypothetical protein
VSGPFSSPLDWPVEQPRHEGERDYGPFKVTLDRAQRELVQELERLGVDHVTISTSARVRNDGFLYASGAEPADPGIAVYWSRGGEDFVIACDSYKHLRSNLRACGLTIYHMRRVEQAAPQMGNRAFGGFKRLPADAGPDGKRPWRDVLGFGRDHVVARADIEGRYLALIKKKHPDARGGSHAAMVELNRAYHEAREAVKS